MDQELPEAEELVYVFFKANGMKPVMKRALILSYQGIDTSPLELS